MTQTIPPPRFEFPESIGTPELAREASRVVSEEAEPALRFTLLLPARFSRAKLEVARVSAGYPSVTFDWRASDGASSIMVRVDHLRREVSPGAWARHHLIGIGHTIRDERTKVTPIGELADILSTKADRVARTNMAKDGEHLYTITCEARDDEWVALAEPFLLTLQSWKLVDPTGAPFSEPIESFSTILPIIAGFLHPASFTLIGDESSEREQSLRWSSGPSERLDLFVRKEFDLDEAPTRAARAFYADCRSRAPSLELAAFETMTPEARLPRDDMATPPGGRGRGVHSPSEARFQILSTRGAIALIAASSPSYVDDPLGWSATERAFELACESLYLVA